MALYNIHKRQTLDRLTASFDRRLHVVLKDHLQHEADRIFEHLNGGYGVYRPLTIKLTEQFEGTFQRHQDRVIHVAVSDGMREVSPDNQVDLWMQFPIGMPIEDTFGVELASKRDKIADEVRARAKRKQRPVAKDDTHRLLDEYLKNIKNVYRNLSAEWHRDGGSFDDILSGLEQALQKSSNDSVRIFRTETTNYFNETRYDYFDAHTAVDYMELYAVTDGRISQICEDRHGAVFTFADAGKSEHMPAFHPHCRTIQRPLLSELASHRSVIERGLRLAERESSWTPLPRNWHGGR